MAGNSAFARYRRRLASRTVHRLWNAALRAGTITPENPAGHPFRAFGMGSLIGFPTGALYGEKWIEIGAGTMIGAQVSMSAGMVPGQDLGEAPVLRIGDRCIIGRGSHIVAHYSIVIGDDVFTGPYVYHRPEPRLYRSRRHHRAAVAKQHGRVHRAGQLARGRGHRVAGCGHRGQRRGRGRFGGTRGDPRPVCGCGSSGEDRARVCAGQRVETAAAGR